MPYGRKKRDHYYRVIDQYSLFYLKWIIDLEEGKELPKGADYWPSILKTPRWFSWAGYAFEIICYKHIDKIIKALGLQGIGCFVSYWLYKDIQKEEGTQIDLLLDRDDGAVTLCEIKYTSQPFVIDKNYAKVLLNQMDTFEKNLKISKQIFLTMVSASGLKKNAWSEELIKQSISLKNLF